MKGGMQKKKEIQAKKKTDYKILGGFWKSNGREIIQRSIKYDISG